MTTPRHRSEPSPDFFTLAKIAIVLFGVSAALRGIVAIGGLVHGIGKLAEDTPETAGPFIAIVVVFFLLVGGLALFVELTSKEEQP